MIRVGVGTYVRRPWGEPLRPGSKQEEQEEEEEEQEEEEGQEEEEQEEEEEKEPLWPPLHNQHHSAVYPT